MFYLALFFMFCFGSDFSPEDQKLLNYNQIFFKWPQINNSSSYQLYINESDIYISDFNSIIVSAIVVGIISTLAHFPIYLKREGYVLQINKSVGRYKR